MLIEVLGTKRTRKRKPIEYNINIDGCWICTSHFIDSDGYPTISCNLVQRKMSRYMYGRFVDKIPEGLVIRHKCDTRNCINPKHLELGTPKDNTMDMIIRGRDKKACGENNGMSKLNWKKVHAIRKDNRKVSIIAKEYAVSPHCIRDVKNYINWA